MEEMKFDPMTGKPLEKVAEEPMKFDPMTGRPLNEVAEASMSFDPMTGKSIIGETNQGKRTKSNAPFNKKYSIIAAIVIGVIIVFAAIKSGIFLGGSGKVLLAATNTIKDQSHLVKALDCSKILLGNKYEVKFEGGSSDADVDMTYSAKKDLKQLKGTVDISDYPSIEYTMQLDAKELKLDIPSLGDYIYTYNYVDKKKGYIADEVDEDTLKSVDQLLKCFYSNKAQQEMYKKLGKAVISEYKKLKFKSVKEEEFEIDGKERKCKGYKTTITSDNAEKLLKNMQTIVVDYCGDIEYGTYESETIEDYFDDLISEAEDMSDVDITVYIYKNKIAAIASEVEDEDEKVVIEFNGGATRCENVCIKNDGEKTLEIKGTTKDNVETLQFYSWGEKTGKLEYDYKKGSLKISGEGDEELELTIKADRKGHYYELVDCYVGGERMEGKISVTNKPNFDKLKGKEFNIGNASEDEFEELFEELEDEIEELSYLRYMF